MLSVLDVTVAFGTHSFPRVWTGRSIIDTSKTASAVSVSSLQATIDDASSAAPFLGSVEERQEQTANDDEAVRRSAFDVASALFCAGFAFDSYVEPPEDSSRWERGSKGMNVAFVSPSFTRSLYDGLLEVKVSKIYDLPDDDDTAEGLMTGGGVDAALLVAAVEGQWKEDVEMLEKESYHEGVLGLQGAAHVGKSRTAWANVNENKSKNEARKNGRALPYHISSSWGKGGQAVYSDEPPFYLYIQDPSKVRLVFTVMDEDVVGDGSPVGSAHMQLTKLIPSAAIAGEDLVEKMKRELVAKIRAQGGDLEEAAKNLSAEDLPDMGQSWEGEIKLTSKPRIKDKNGQVAMGVAAGAMVAGPVGAAAGALLGSMYEGQVRGRIVLGLRYMPLPPINVARKVYEVKGGLDGVNWGEMHRRFLTRRVSSAGDTKTDDYEGSDQDDDSDNEDQTESSLGSSPTDMDGELNVPDMEHCFFINHDVTGGCCSVYRSLEKKLIVVSFRGTCNAKDLVTDASIAQSPWVEGEDEESTEDLPKVHTGFRRSLDSISRRLKELLLAVPAKGEDISEYDMLVTGHSLGGALSTLFAMDIAQFGIDAGRSLPQKAPSEAWWKSIASQLSGGSPDTETRRTPPRPKSLRMYNFGSPRVGNHEFAALFDTVVQEGKLKEAYRIVNGEDIVARLPRTINALALGNIRYEHCGATALVTSDTVGYDEDGVEMINPKIWIEGESDDSRCPVRDGTPLTSPLADGSLLSDILNATKTSFGEDGDTGDNEEAERNLAVNLRDLAGKIGGRLQTLKATDITGMLGIDSTFAEREAKIIQSIASGDGLADHMEDKYYGSMGRATGFLAVVGEEIRELES